MVNNLNSLKIFVGDFAVLCVKYDAGFCKYKLTEFTLGKIGKKTEYLTLGYCILTSSRKKLLVKIHCENTATL